jgi:hypothetical protein
MNWSPREAPTELGFQGTDCNRGQALVVADCMGLIQDNSFPFNTKQSALNIINQNICSVLTTKLSNTNISCTRKQNPEKQNSQ